LWPWLGQTLAFCRSLSPAPTPSLASAARCLGAPKTATTKTTKTAARMTTAKLLMQREAGARKLLRESHKPGARPIGQCAARELRTWPTPRGLSKRLGGESASAAYSCARQYQTLKDKH